MILVKIFSDCNLNMTIKRIRQRVLYLDPITPPGLNKSTKTVKSNKN